MVGETPVDFNKGAEFKNTKWLEKLQWILIKGVEFKKTKWLEKLQWILIKGRGLKALNAWRNSSGF